jgi:hypothetical protein
MRQVRLITAASIVFVWGHLAHGAVQYPFKVTLDARTENVNAAVTSKVTITVDRLMEASRHKRVSDALKFGGYPSFLTTLRSIPPVGSIGLATREVEIRYAHETAHADGRRVVLAADRPLFFLANDPVKSRAGYELTLVELIVRDNGEIVGTMTGAARVKPGPDDIPVVDSFAETPVRLAGRVGP